MRWTKSDHKLLWIISHEMILKKPSESSPWNHKRCDNKLYAPHYLSWILYNRKHIKLIKILSYQLLNCFSDPSIKNILKWKVRVVKPQKFLQLSITNLLTPLLKQEKVKRESEKISNSLRSINTPAKAQPWHHLQLIQAHLKKVVKF